MLVSVAIASPRHVGNWRDWFSNTQRGEDRVQCACCSELVITRWVSWQLFGVSITLEWLVDGHDAA
jgi:hypothetical protein